MTSPLRITFDVACPAGHAFDMWTARIGTWWPSDHTVAGERDLLVMLEGAVGGRIFERTVAGVEAIRLDDGVSFVHVALLDGDENPCPRWPPSASSSRLSTPAAPTDPPRPMEP